MTQKRRPAPALWSQLELPPIPLLDALPDLDSAIQLDPIRINLELDSITLDQLPALGPITLPDLDAPIRLDQTAPPRTRRRRPRR